MPCRPRRRAAFAVACVLAGLGRPSPLDARGLTVEAALQAQAFGEARLDPQGRWAAWARLGPYAAAGRFDLDRWTDVLRTSVDAVDLTRPGPPRRLLPGGHGVGYALGPVSPDGRRLAVFRLRGERWDLGVVEMPSGRTRWLALAPEISDRGRAAAWRDGRRLLVLAAPPGLGPLAFRTARPEPVLAARRRAAAKGAATGVALGSGAYLDRAPRGPPGRLVEVDAATGQARTFAEGRFDDLEVAADGRWAALLERGPDIGLSADRPAQGPMGVETQRRRLRLVDLRQGVVRPACVGQDVLGQLLAWSADDRLLLYGRADGDAWPEGRLRVASPAGDCPAVDAGVEPQVAGRPATVRAGWLGPVPVVFGRLRAAGAAPRQDWIALTAAGPRALTAGLPPPAADGAVADGAALWVQAGTDLWRASLDGLPTRIAPVTTAGAPPADGPPRRDQRGLIAPADWSATGVGRLWRFGRLGPRPLPAPGPEADALVIAANAAGALMRREDPAGAQRLAWVGAAAPPRALGSIAALAERPGPLVAVRQAGPGGREVTSWVVLPPPGDGPPPPLVVLPYPGLAYATAPDLRRPRRGSDLERAALLVGRGYAVLLPSLPGDPAAGGPADGLGGRLAALVDAAAATPGAAGRFDPQRVAVWGFSFGGYGALAAITQTDRFGAAIAQSPISDLISKAGELSARTWAWPDAGPTAAWSSGWTEDLQGGMRAPSWREPARYVRNSPVLAAGRVRTPLLLEHGDLDPIPVGQSAEMFTALFRQGKDAQLVVYAGEGHVLTSPGNIRDFYRRAFAFLDEHLRNGSPSARAAAHRAAGSASGAPRPP